jgi:hypothetical protein
MPIKSTLAAVISPFSKNKNFIGQREVKVYLKNGKLAENAKFVDATFQAMLKGVGWIDGLAWCAFFVKVFLMSFYSFDSAWINKNLTGGALNNLYTIEALNSRGFKTWVASRKNDPQIGDIVVWKSTTDSSKGHTGIITAIDSSSWTTIEGNTAAKKEDREGDLVASKTRPISTSKIGYKGGGLQLLGFFRRNFTPSEAAKLYFDEKEQTLKFRG